MPFVNFRRGYPEVTYATFSYSPILNDEGQFGGVLCPVSEETDRIIGQRQMTLLRHLAAKTLDARTREEACACVVEALQADSEDIPFALIYEFNIKTNIAELKCSSGISSYAASVLKLNILNNQSIFPLKETIEKNLPKTFSDLDQLAKHLPLVKNQYPITQAKILPLAPSGDDKKNALVIGLSPLRPFDEKYQEFLHLVASSVSSAIQNTDAYEAEKRRAESLAELDRAKTAFFSNVSHEFRTPLTLILSPLEDALAEVTEPHQRERLELLHRNALRLQKLVNTLLDFSRIEAGRMHAVYEPVDLAKYTTELASAFRSAIEKAGMKLIVDCPPLTLPVYVDRDMYEKIVLNLLSNAFKFTLKGEIKVILRDNGSTIHLSIIDTGTGIAENQLPHIFERFHRIEGASVRTHEGTGIGLALVAELVNLHGGSIDVKSTLGQGSHFTVIIPKGYAHLPNDHIATKHHTALSALGSNHYLNEELRWLPDESESFEVTHDTRRPRIVWADDNADMRDYVKRLLAGRYDVEAVSDGEAALNAVHHLRPDLVLADVMMPRLDGFGLLRALRNNNTTRSIPIILLSARAGEECRVDGMTAGADDYLVKPFSARELVARIDANIKISHLRLQNEQSLKENDRRKDEFLAVLSHELRNPLVPLKTAIYLLQQINDISPVHQNLIQMMERQINHMVRLVDDLLEISRIITGKIELHSKSIPLSEIINNAIEVSKPLFDNNQHELRLLMSPQPIMIHADIVRITQVFVNLLNNAAKYTPKKGIITVKVSTSIKNAVISIQDNGIGILAERLPNIFEMFTQGKHSDNNGLGIGLAMVRSLTELHGGTVKAHSAGLNLGSEFIVTLPLVQEDKYPVIENSLPNKDSSLSHLRVLLVDDSQDITSSFTLLLTSWGINVRSVNNGKSALATLDDFRPHIILLDIGMPDMNGYEVAEIIRQNPTYASIKIIALTGWNQESDRNKSHTIGFTDHLAKPVDINHLKNLLNKMIEDEKILE